MTTVARYISVQSFLIRAEDRQKHDKRDARAFLHDSMFQMKNVGDRNGVYLGFQWNPEEKNPLESDLESERGQEMVGEARPIHLPKNCASSQPSTVRS